VLLLILQNFQKKIKNVWRFCRKLTEAKLYTNSIVFEEEDKIDELTGLKKYTLAR
jgi:hypothetical protein